MNETRARAERSYVSTIPELFRDLGVRVISRIESRFVEVNGLRLHYRSGPKNGRVPFVLIPGLVISSLYWIPLAECLALHSPVIALDLPGFGRSAGPRRSLSIPELARVIGQWLDALGIDRCHLAGNSMGCQISAHLAVNEPERVETLSLIGPTIDPRYRWLPIQVLKLIGDAFQEPAGLWLNWAFDFCRAGLLRPFGTTRWMFRDRIEERLPRVQCRTLILRGEYDTTVPDRWGRTVKEMMPNAKYLVVPKEAHCAHYTEPEIVAQHLLAHAGITQPSFGSPMR